MKKTAAERLACADAAERLSDSVASLLNRIDDYCTDNGYIRIGCCIASPKYATYQQLTKQVDEELRKQAKDHYRSLKIHKFIFKYFTPPLIPIIEGRDVNTPLSVEDYKLTFLLPEFNAKEAERTVVRSLLYCPSPREFNHEWNEEWFEIEDEAIRLVPLLNQQIEEQLIVRQIRLYLAENGMPYFESFAIDFTLRTEHLGISSLEKKLLKEGKTSWQKYHHRIKNLFSTSSTLHDFYSVAKGKILKTRDSDDKLILSSFVDFIETSLIKETKLPEDLKNFELDKLRGYLNKGKKNGYQAERPVVSLSDVECAKFLNFLLRKFIENPKKYRSLGEVALYIWICQHAAFSGISLKVEEVLEMKVSQIKFSQLTIKKGDNEIFITQGLTDILRAWIGKKTKENEGRLFPISTNYDKIEKIIKKYSKILFGKNNGLQPRDFLMKVHVIPYARLTAPQRSEIDNQASLIKDSPYRIRNREIKKLIIDHT